MSDWKEYVLADLMEIIGGGTPKTSIPEYWGGDIPWLSVVDFGGSIKTVFKTEKSITYKGLENSSTKILNKGQLIISARGTVGELAVLGNDMAFNQSCYGLNAHESICSNNYLYYLLKCKISELKQNSHGAVFDTITRSTFEHVYAKVPDIKTQHQIAEILSSLDDKIELNNRINAELEALAQTLFKRWFVDFEFPNEKGEPYKSSGGEMVESELGMIPNGWENSTIENITEVVTKGTTPTTIGGRFTDTGINFIKVESISEQGTFISSKFGYIDELTHQMLKRSIIEEGDVLFSIAGTIGRVAVVTKDILPANTNQAVAILRPKVSSYFLKTLMKSSMIQRDTKSNVVQAVQANLSLGVIKATKFVLPSVKVLQLFDQTIKYLVEEMNNLTRENLALEGIKTTLLPRLMSGEIEIMDLHTENLLL